MNNTWDERFLKLAEHIALWSRDPSTKCGSVISEGKRIISLGFNGFPARTNDSEELYNDRPEKYRRVIHAEQNAMAFANRDLYGCTLYVWPAPPCSQCAAMIIQRGITRVVTIRPSDDYLSRWKDSVQSTLSMFHEAGVDLVYVEQEYGCHCDLLPGMSPDDCVIDKNERHNCLHAECIDNKEQCKHWGPINLI